MGHTKLQIGLCGFVLMRLFAYEKKTWKRKHFLKANLMKNPKYPMSPINTIVFWFRSW